MDLEAPKKESFWLRYTQHTMTSVCIATILVPLCLLGLYIWAKSLGTCVNRPSFTLLSMLESLTPWLMHPLQNMVCPH